MKYTELSEDAKIEALKCLQIARPDLSENEVEQLAIEYDNSIEYNEFGSIVAEYL